MIQVCDIEGVGEYAERYFAEHPLSPIIVDRTTNTLLAVHTERLGRIYPPASRVAPDGGLAAYQAVIPFHLWRAHKVMVDPSVRPAHEHGLKDAKLSICMNCDHFNDHADTNRYTCDKVTKRKPCCGGRVLPAEDAFAAMIRSGMCPIGKHNHLATNWYIDSARARGLGDVVMMSGCVRILYAHCKRQIQMPKNRGTESVFAHDPRVRLVAPAFKPPRQCNKFTFDYALKSPLNVIEAACRANGFEQPDGIYLPDLIVTDDEVRAAYGRYGDDYCVFSAGNVDPNDVRVFPTDMWRSLFRATRHIRWLCPAHLQPYTLDEPNVEYIGIHLDIRGMMAVVKNATACVAVDTGVSHMAVGVGTPSILLLSGQFQAASFSYPVQKVVRLGKQPACSPCHWSGNRPCTVGQRPCQAIDPSALIEAVQEVLHATRDHRFNGYDLRSSGGTAGGPQPGDDRPDEHLRSVGGSAPDAQPAEHGNEPRVNPAASAGGSDSPATA